MLRGGDKVALQPLCLRVIVDVAATALALGLGVLEAGDELRELGPGAIQSPKHPEAPNAGEGLDEGNDVRGLPFGKINSLDGVFRHLG